MPKTVFEVIGKNRARLTCECGTIHELTENKDGELEIDSYRVTRKKNEDDDDAQRRKKAPSDLGTILFGRRREPAPKDGQDD